jgi:DNA-directed RNA polymerase specialized sigma24 family protein
MDEVKLTPRKFEEAKRVYEEAVKERARQIVIMKEELGWSFDKIGKEFGISRQAAQNIYKNITEEDNK